jgi:hypothetical protein
MPEDVMDMKGLKRSSVFIKKSSEMKRQIKMLKTYNPPVVE